MKIYITMPSASAKERRDILDICKETGCRIRILPGMYQIINGEVSVDDTVVVIYGDHDAKISKKEYKYFYNYRFA